ncbi:unnamed protein product [Acanthosepion pharaonis]|uniref:Opioid growth factor receptor (OGFr) conserved domain-containing protein n=1 Tax=Acanthosepion pharaonis TaxID=158019 RepID=A0A812BCI4_ACAPH|nr:unnamed protein product [Sepia pharaonis]
MCHKISQSHINNFSIYQSLLSLIFLFPLISLTLLLHTHTLSLFLPLFSSISDFPLSIDLSLSLFFYTHTHSLTLSLPLCLYHPEILTRTLRYTLTVALALYFSLSIFLTHSLKSVTHSQAHTLSLIITLNFILTYTVTLSLCLSLSLSVSVSLSLSLSISLAITHIFSTAWKCCNEIKFEPDGDFIEDVLEWTGKYDLLEHNRAYIQWLFPRKNTVRNTHAFPLTNEEAKIIRETPKLKERVKRAFVMMLEFYGMILTSHGQFELSLNAEERLQKLNTFNNHNFYRISRILDSLQLLGHGDLILPHIHPSYTQIQLDCNSQ